MKALGVTVVLGLLVGVWAQINELRPKCDSPEAEEAALVAQDYLNAQHTHGYKYALNRVEDIKIVTRPDGEETYVLEIDLLETDCYVLDPTPVANCTVRPKLFTAVEGECDVVLKKIGGALTVTAFKCKTDESREEYCAGCFSLLPLNNTGGLKFVHTSVAAYNNMTQNVTYTLLNVGRMSSRFLPGGLQYSVEFVIIEANCTDDVCLPLNEPLAEYRFCTAEGIQTPHTVTCRMFNTLMPVVDANSTAAPALLPVVHIQTDSLSHKHGLGHHKLTSFHDPHVSGLLSAESLESAEVVPIAPAVVTPAAAEPAPAVDPSPAADLAPAADPGSASDSSSSKEIPLLMFKREVPAALVDLPVVQTEPTLLLVPVCPGRVRFF